MENARRIDGMHFPVILADWLETIDRINDAVSHPDWNATVHNPWFLLGSVAFIIVSLLRGWKSMLVLYFGAMAMWYIVANYVMTKHGGGGNILVFAGGIVVVGGFAIYMLLIRD